MRGEGRKEGRQEGRAYLGWQFERHGSSLLGKAWFQGHAAAAHIVSTARNQEEKNVGAQLTLSLLFSVRPQPWYGTSHVLPFQVNTSGHNWYPSLLEMRARVANQSPVL